MSYHTTAPWEKSPAPQYFEKSPRQQSQFPSKYSHLPQIKSPSPHPMDSQLVPVNATDGKLRLGMRSSGHLDMEGDERIREMEMRLTVSEKSNRALLEEVLRLQNEIKSSGRRSDDILREERKARQDVETSIKVCSDLISQLTARIKTTEERVQEEKMTLSTLVNHTKGVEQVVLSSQHELLNKKAVQSTKLQELQTEVSSTVQAKNKLESLSYRLADDVHQLKSKVDSQGAEHQNIISDLKLRSKRLEEENRLQLDTMRKQTEAHTAMESQVTQLKGQVETRLSELRDVLVEVRNKQDTEVTERRNSEQHFQTRLSDLYQTMAEQNRKREESIHAVDIAIREKEHMAQTERMTLTTQVSDTVEEVNKKLLAKEIKIREELQDRFIQLEKMIQQEQHARRDHEKSMRDDNEKRWHALRKVQEEELHTVKDAMKSEKGKSKGTLQKLDDSISLLERQQHESKKQIDKVLAAEIQSRKIHEKNTAEHMASLNEKLQLDKVRRDVKSIQGDQQQAMMRTMTDLDTRVVNQSKKITTLEEVLDAKVATASAALSQNLREKIESISLWQDATAQTIRELKHNVQSLPQDLYALEEKHKLLKAEIDSRMSAESEMRTQEIEMMKHDLQALKLRKDPRGPTIQDMEMMQSGVRKMADSIQTIKTVLGMKIQSEQKLRIEELKNIQDELDKLKAAVEPLIKKPFPKVFVKDPGKEAGSSDDPDVNKWGVYNAYRWSTWKARLNFLRWQGALTPTKGKNRKGKGKGNGPKKDTKKSSDQKPGSQQSDESNW
ncbi:hypothetical protein ScPMuIL_004090 [Solemya velum]